MEKFLYLLLSVPDWVAAWGSVRQSVSGIWCLGVFLFWVWVDFVRVCESVKSKGKW